MERSKVAHRFSILLTLALASSPAWAFKPYTHGATADRALQDALDGTVTLAGRDYPIRMEVAEALRNWPEYYAAGVIGPDGFPDLVYGQSVIHPGTEASDDARAADAATGKWLAYLLDRAWAAQTDGSYSPDEKQQILAFTYGYLTHAAGDMWAHTLVNDFADGVFPSVSEVLGDPDKASIALRHVIVEGYIGDATPGWDGYRDDPSDHRLARGPAPFGDVSDDSTPGRPFDAPHRFLYETLIDEGAPTPVASRGQLIEYFQDMRAELDAFTPGTADPLGDALNAFADTMAALDEVRDACDFEDLADIIDCPVAVAELFWDAVVDSFEAFLAFAEGVIEDAVSYILDAYYQAWIEDIDDGLRAWSELGLATTRGLFDPQARRDVQNADCGSRGSETDFLRIDCEQGVGLTATLFGDNGTANDFVNQHLLSMLGLPDFVGEVRAALQRIMSDLEDTFYELGLTDLNPLLQSIEEIKQYFAEIFKEAISEALGIDIEQLEVLLSSPSDFLCLEDVHWDFPAPLGAQDVLLFPPGEHDRLDGFLAVSDPHHSAPDDCSRLDDATELVYGDVAVTGNTITLAKLVLLDGDQLNALMGDVMLRDVSTYSGDDNIMVRSLEPRAWLRSIDSDHAWREDGLPRFCTDGSAAPCPPGATLRPAELVGGTGRFPIWESCVLRTAFRSLFKDWENGGAPFPDLSDVPSADPANDPLAPVSFLDRAGAFYDDGARQFVGGDNVFTLTAADAPPGRAFLPELLGLRYRIAHGATPTGAHVAARQGETLSLVPPDGRWWIGFQSEDPCHAFSGAPDAPEPEQLAEYWLDTTPPITTCPAPPFAMVHDTFDVVAAGYVVDDGPDGSGVAAFTSTIDGWITADGVRAVAQDEGLDTYWLWPGARTIVVDSVDNIGNGGTGSCAFGIHATVESLMADVDRARALRAIEKEGLRRSLLSKLRAAQASRDRGNRGAEINQLEAFVNEIRTQRGKSFEAVTADRFIAWGEDLISAGG